MNVNTTFYFHRKDPMDYQIKFHYHQSYELIYYYSGKGYCCINEKKYAYKPHTVMIIPPNSLHNDVHQSDCELLCIGFTLDKKPTTITFEGAYEDVHSNIEKYLQTLMQEFEEQRRNYIPVVNNLLENILMEISRFSMDYTERHVGHNESIEQTVNYINEYFLTDIDSTQLATMINYSYSRFRHVFKNVMGISPRQYIIKKRLEHAKRLLTSTKLSITEIGYQCLFSSTSFFIQQFKKNTGITPAAYRKQLHSNEIFSEEQSLYQ